MIVDARNSCSALLLLALAFVPVAAMATDKASAGVTQECTKDKTYDKTIGGLIYSCYDSKQALCKDGGNGGISGTATSSVCTEKDTTFRPISLDDQSRGGDTLAPKPTTSSRPGRTVDPLPAKFDEADALFGKRSEQRDHRAKSAQTTRDHRKQSDRTNTIVEVGDGTSNTLSARGLQAPSDLAIRSVSPTALTLAWRDNSTDEFGVELYRADPNQRQLNPENAWKLVGTFQERNLDNVAGTGMRLDEDAGLSPGARYCYRMRAYSGFRRTQVSGFSEVACAETTSSASRQTRGAAILLPGALFPIPTQNKDLRKKNEVASVAMTASTSALAQENVLGPPAVLQYPFEAGADAPRGVTILLLRDQIERAADLALCKVLMSEAGRPIPVVFNGADCESAFAEQVRDGEGIVHWAGSARPLQCGEDCVGAPFLTQTEFVTRPNLRRATLHGKLMFVVDPPGPTNRAITFGYNVHFTCEAENGARSGTFTIDVEMHEPVIGEPGFLESALNFFTGGSLSRFIEGQIRQGVTAVGDVSEERGRCLSVGVSRAANPNLAFTDGVVFDPAPAESRAGRPGIGSRASVGTRAELGDRATVHFLRITRKQLPSIGGAGQAAPGSSEMGHFDVFLNGSRVAFPPTSPTATGGIDLPPEGGAVELNYCRTIDMTDSDHLQLLFTNGLGGAVWSQFARGDEFGANGAKTMTTGRTVVVPGSPGPPNSLTGRPTQTKPESVTLREFELVYAITFTPRSDTVAPTQPASPDQRPGRGRRPGRVVTPTLGDAPVVAVDPSAPAPQPCRQI